MSAEPAREPAASFVARLDALLDRHAPELRGRISTADDDGLDLPRLAEPAVAERALAGFRRRYPCGEPRAVASLFVQWYAATAWPSLVVALIVLNRLPSPATTALRLDELGTPVGVIVKDHVASTTVAAGLEELIRGHAAALVANAAGAARLSPRVPWSNVSNVLGWTLEQLQSRAPDYRLDEARALLARRRFDDGAPNPLWIAEPGAWRAKGRPPRRTCCLRYRLDAVPYCGDCPVPEKRRT
ncbi:MAG TPA: siderophore-iron reductase FhuF [Arenicellales bacterium]|nr:siderophore-iron reductase FhuF [Arenicellales bacterium]